MIYGIKVNNLIGSPLLGGVVYAQIIKLYMDFLKYKPKYIFYSIFNFDLLFILNPLISKINKSVFNSVRAKLFIMCLNK